MHAMHGAALLGLVGFLVPAIRVILAFVDGASINLAIAGQIAMAILCAVFLVLCIRSFIAARRARTQRPS